MTRWLPIFTIALLAGIMCDCGTNGPVAGATDTETGGITATAFNTDGTPAANAIVRLRRSDYVTQPPLLAKSAHFGADVLTDSTGRFEIAGVDPGSYRIEVTDGRAAVLLACSLDVGDTADLGVDTLRPFATIIGAAGTSSPLHSLRYVQIVGLERLAMAGIDGRYDFTDLPAGIFSLRIGPAESGAPARTINAVPALCGDTTVTPSPLPAPWTGASIGNETPSGGAMYTGGRFTITGGGPDIWGLADGFHFVYQPWSGDGEIIARVAQFEYGARCSKAGVMFRETLDPASVNVTASLEIDSLIPGQDVLCVHHRAAAEDTSSTLCHIAPYRAPQWIRLVRQGNVFRASVSPDGATWVAACADTLSMVRDVFVGLSVTSHDTTKLSTAVFEGVEVR